MSQSFEYWNLSDIPTGIVPGVGLGTTRHQVSMPMLKIIEVLAASYCGGMQQAIEPCSTTPSCYNLLTVFYLQGHNVRSQALWYHGHVTTGGPPHCWRAWSRYWRTGFFGVQWHGVCCMCDAIILTSHQGSMIPGHLHTVFIILIFMFYLQQ